MAKPTKSDVIGAAPVHTHDAGGDWLDVNLGIGEFWEPTKGEVIVGRLIDRRELKRRDTGEVFWMHMVDAEGKGVLSVGGAELTSTLLRAPIGIRVRIEFLGQFDIGKGRTMNRYRMAVDKSAGVKKPAMDVLAALDAAFTAALQIEATNGAQSKLQLEAQSIASTHPQLDGMKA